MCLALCWASGHRAQNEQEPGPALGELRLPHLSTTVGKNASPREMHSKCGPKRVLSASLELLEMLNLNLH